MLKIFNDLEPFFQDCYERINVRAYARIRNISPPSASKLLYELQKEGLLIREENRNYIYYAANKDSKLFIELSRIYWYQKLMLSGLTVHLEKEFVKPMVILFGSFSKAEVYKNSDIDLAIFSTTAKQVRLKAFEAKLGRNIQLFQFKNKDDVTSAELLNNILNGFILSGTWY